MTTTASPQLWWMEMAALMSSNDDDNKMKDDSEAATAPRTGMKPHVQFIFCGPLSIASESVKVLDITLFAQ